MHAERDASLDAVVCRDVVWTLPDPARAYAEWFRVLKPGGTLVVFDGDYLYKEPEGLLYRLWYALSWTLILLTEWRVRRRTSKDQPALGELPFVQVLRPEADETALRQAGFTIREIRRNFIPGYKWSLNYLKYGCQTGVRFMIIAKKELSA
ncbi:methyltransferase domain-containing protein [Paenibacillus filicis]|uniref:Methyltransferase domain-containing protein n=1 Tax=Paenibacillus filicis TaxID=669464 RepID=A0ABU9DS24_9BACL